MCIRDRCNLKSKKLAGLVGQRVRQCSDASLAARLANAGAVLRIVAVGKECFVVFEQLALRLHYAMSGSQCVRDVSSEPQPLPAGSRMAAWWSVCPLGSPPGARPPRHLTA